MKTYRKEGGIDFIGVGAQKAGTTWLFERLSELPDFSMPIIKEFHYFDRNKTYLSPSRLTEAKLSKRMMKMAWWFSSIKHIGSKLREGKIRNWFDFLWIIKWFFSDYADGWYLSMFKGLNGISGEITPSYSMLAEEDITRMYKINPNLKLILLLRNPVDRAWSHYRHSIKSIDNFGLNSVNIAEIINFMDKEEQELRSDYLRTIENYSKVFPSKQLLIGFYDSIKANPKKLLLEIVTFLGSKESNVEQYCNVSNKENVSLKMDMPDEVFIYLKKKYYALIKQLSEEYGGYCSQWLHDLYNEEANEQIELKPTFIVAKH